MKKFFHFKQISQETDTFLWKNLFSKNGIQSKTLRCDIENHHGGLKSGNLQKFMFFHDGLSQNLVQKGIQAVYYYLGELGLNPGKPFKDTDYSQVTSFVIEWNQDNGSYPELAKTNPIMRKELENGAAVDVRVIGFEIEPGVFKLNHYIDGIDYADSESGKWINSIGKDKETGEILAAIDGRFRNNDEYENIWLR